MQPGGRDSSWSPDAQVRKDERVDEGEGTEDTLRVDRIGPRISEFEFVVLSADSIVIAYLRGACTPETAASTYFMSRPTKHARVHPHVFARHPTWGTFILGRHVVYTLVLPALFSSSPASSGGALSRG